MLGVWWWGLERNVHLFDKGTSCDVQESVAVNNERIGKFYP